jgi:hypothetical protein
MDLFYRTKPKSDPAKIEQIKSWIYQLLSVDSDTPISISQLLCTETGCPPLETVIAIMTIPVKQYKIHQSLDDISYADIVEAIQNNCVS